MNILLVSEQCIQWVLEKCLEKSYILHMNTVVKVPETVKFTEKSIIINRD
jgi:hypothetical protein